MSQHKTLGLIPGGLLFGDHFGKREDQKKAGRKSRAVVYFIQAGTSGGPIKIGFTSSLRSRLSSLQTGNPVPLSVLGTFPGGQDEESVLHQRFRHLHISLEWFRPDNELYDVIEEKCGVKVDRKWLLGVLGT